MNSKFDEKAMAFDPNGLVEFDGQKGMFYLANSSGLPEIENPFFYGDDNHQFVFYVDIVKSSEAGQPSTIVIYHATNRARGGGGAFHVPLQDLAYIEENIRGAFKDRLISSLETQISGANRPVVFKWRVAK